MLPMGVHETCPNPSHMVKMLGQATWIQMNFNSYLCIRVVINYQKERKTKILVHGEKNKDISVLR